MYKWFFTNTNRLVHESQKNLSVVKYSTAAPTAKSTHLALCIVVWIVVFLHFDVFDTHSVVIHL